MSTRRHVGRATGLAAVIAVAAGLAVPVTGSAATKTVEAGPFGDASKQLRKYDADLNTFFRKTVTVRKGDTVQWRLNGFHTVTFVPRGEAAPGLVVPDLGNPLSGVNDAAGQPFWFNGQPRLILNPLVAFKQGGSTFSADRLNNSGLPLDEGEPRPYKLKFDRTGTFSYLCIVHQGMKGSVRVVGKRRNVPSKATDRQIARRHQRTLVQRAQRLSTGLGTTKLVNTVQAGNDDRSGVAIFDFFPRKAPTFKVNTPITLRMPLASSEDHTFTFGPANGRDAYVDLIARNFVSPQGGGSGPPTLVIEPRAGYPSEDPSAGVPDLDGTNHGNGFYNSGVLDRRSASPLPGSVKVRFTKPGTYSFLCAIHPFMRGSLKIVP